MVAEMAHTWNGATNFAFGAFRSVPMYIAAAGVATAWVFVLWRPQWGDAVRARCAGLNVILDNKFYFDWINENILAPLARGVGLVLWRAGDQAIIDTAAVNGSAETIGWVAGVTRRMQSGFLYSYAFWMIIGLAALLGWFLSRLSGL
jgi:NADH-quinone oxidoreductase subunit L